MISYSVSAKDKVALQSVLSSISENPYHDYIGFKEAISAVVNKGHIPEQIHRFINDTRLLSCETDPFIFIEGLPVDNIIPFFKNKNPVEEKRILKKTFVSEGVLEMFAQIRVEYPIGYLNVNDGDVFQDIFPKEDLFESQSQKALNDIYFHKDLANHFVRPDWVNLFCLRNSVENLITTSFTRNIDVISEFSKEELIELSQPIFHTPYDDLSTYHSLVKLGEAELHPILTSINDYDIRFFESRTLSKTKSGRYLIEKLIRLLHKHKTCIHLRSGDFIGENNNYSLHCKKVVSMKNRLQAKQRWIMKTVNVNSYHDISQWVVDDRKYLING